jgi:vacuolar protein sorting-associated protein 52
MEAVPAAETLEGQKERFDLGIFVGNVALDEEVTR